jgi:hypothetical protein
MHGFGVEKPTWELNKYEDIMLFNGLKSLYGKLPESAGRK